MEKLLTPYHKNGFSLKNRIVMAPMTRSRATNNIPNALMAEYYGQRSEAGLIITEGTAPVPDGLGYPRIPGIFSPEQVNGWKTVTSTVHKSGSRIFLQIMHTGRIGHPDNLPAGATLVGPSNIKAAGYIYTDANGRQAHPEPVALTQEGIAAVTEGFVSAARNAMEAGFDGIELHGANGYLLEQFLNPHINNRTDAYGGSIANRARLTLEIARQTAAAIGKEKVGIRFSPYSTFGDLPHYREEEVHATYSYLAKELSNTGIAYIHISMNDALPESTLSAIRSGFNGSVILCNGFTPATAETAVHNGAADLVAFGKAFLANPDLVTRISRNAALNPPRMEMAYTPGPEGYTDYPFLDNA
jgi:N-ethylmaleimide reductase